MNQDVGESASWAEMLVTGDVGGDADDVWHRRDVCVYPATLPGVLFKMGPAFSRRPCISHVRTSVEVGRHAPP